MRKFIEWISAVSVARPSPQPSGEDGGDDQKEHGAERAHEQHADSAVEPGVQSSQLGRFE